MSRAPALFLDRDGVINHDSGYTYRIEDFHWIDGIFEVARLAVGAGRKLVVVTNQSGIARGLYDEAAFATLTAWMRERFAAEGTPLTAVYYCPHHPDGNAPYRVACACRKPQPGMFLAAAQDHGLDLAASIMVGDKEIDMEAAQAAGVPRRVLFGWTEIPDHGLATAAVSDHATLARWLQGMLASKEQPLPCR